MYIERPHETEKTRRTFGYGNDHKRNRDDQNLRKRDALLTCSALGLSLAKLHEEPDHKSDEQNEARRASELSDEFGEVIQFRLQRRILRLSPQRYALPKPKKNNISNRVRKTKAKKTAYTHPS